MAEQRLTILQLNDSHGYMDQHVEMFWSGGQAAFAPAGGFSRIKRMADEIRAETDGRMLFFDCGDTIHGTHAAVQSKGEAVIRVANELGLDAWTAHWEFAWGPEHLREIAGRMAHPLLAINCYDKQTDRPYFDTTRVIERAGLRIGVIGIAAVIVDRTMPPHFSEGVYLTIGNEELPGHIQRLRGEEQCDLIVVVSHSASRRR